MHGNSYGHPCLRPIGGRSGIQLLLRTTLALHANSHRSRKSTKAHCKEDHSQRPVDNYVFIQYICEAVEQRAPRQEIVADMADVATRLLNKYKEINGGYPEVSEAGARVLPA